MSMGIFTLSLGAGESREAAISGEYFELRNALSPVVLIELLDRSGGVIARLDNPEQSDFVRPGRYETIRITNGATAQTIKHFYGSGDAGSRRTSGLVRIDGASDVSVIDGGKARTIGGLVFAYAHGSPAVAANYSRVQLYNPAGSLRRVVLKAYKVSSPATTTAYAITKAGPLATIDAAITNNKLPGGLAPVAQGATEQTAALLSVGLLDSLNFSGVATGAFVFQEPVVLNPGFGFVVQNQNVNQRIDASYEWFEEVI